MAAEDLGRDAFDPKKRYAAVRMQQGRVTLDDDFNEAARIESEDERRLRLDVIGPAGTPDDGFRVTDGQVLAGGIADFTIKAGTFYLGGLRVENPDDVRFVAQPDYLQQPLAERMAAGPGSVDFLWLEVWQQPVTAVEDAELFEVGLAGPDTSARVRTMWRVHRRTRIIDPDPDCQSEWSKLVAEWAADDLGTLAPSGERVVDARVHVDYLPGSPPGDLCQPPVIGGYLGAENQAIRVEIVDDSHFTWGFDNASPVYRARYAPQAPPTDVTIELLTDPKDQAHWPLAGQTVEVLPWSAVLPNNEKLAELSGHLARVTGMYDPDTRTFTVDEVPDPFGNGWTTRPDAAALWPNADPPYQFLRVWNRGADLTDATVPFIPGQPVQLGQTGIRVTFSGTDFVPGDHWIIAARPETPNRVVPWSLEAQRAPHGVRRFFAPLALIRWKTSPNGGLAFDLLHDCRPTFLPLTRLGGCCTVTVGDGLHSFGMYKTIQEAVDNLPAAGGKVCVLPGEHAGQVSIVGKHDVTIEGCGARSKVLAPDGFGFSIAGSHDITIRALFLDAGVGTGISITQSSGPTPLGAADAEVPPGPIDLDALPDPATAGSGVTQRITIEDLQIETHGGPAIRSWGGRFLTIRRCRIRGRLDQPLADPELGRWSSVVISSDDVVIEDNEIVAADTAKFVETPFGGIQIGGRSERIEIRGNTIRGGSGDGVTLGSYAWVPLSWVPVLPVHWEAIKLIPPGWGWLINVDNCVEIPWFPFPPPDDDPADPMVPVSLGALRDVRIADNVIEDMGRAGIGVVRWFRIQDADDGAAIDGEMIVTDRLTIENNRIRRCVQLPRDAVEPPAQLQYVGQGAITLAAGERIAIRDNVIEHNGKSHVDPICGVFALTSQGMLIDRNRIVDNAPRTSAPDPARAGWRGGVVLTLARPATVKVTPGLKLVKSMTRQNGVPAARIHDNVIVVPEGRCVLVIGDGPMSIADNQLTSRGIGTASGVLVDSQNIPPPPGASPFESVDQFGGCVAFVMNLGRSNELGSQIDLFRMLGAGNVDDDPSLIHPLIAAEGTILFEGNQAVLDLLDKPIARVFSSVFLLTSDDVACTGNQLTIDEELDYVKTNVYASGFSARVSDNRLTERLNHGSVDALSAVCIGHLASATDNHATHCLVVVGAIPELTHQAGNLVLADPGPDGCSDAHSVSISLAKHLKEGH